MITVASSTDSPAQVAEAAGIEETPTETSTKNPPAANTGAKPDASSESGDGSGPSEEGNEPQDDDSAQSTEDRNEDSDEDSDDEDSADGQPKLDADGKPIKGKGGFQKRIDRATKKIGTLESDLQRERQAAFQLQQKIAQMERERAEAAKPAPKPDDKPAPAPASTLRDEPKVGDFKTYEEYLADFGKWAKEAIADARTTAETQAAKKVSEEVEKLRAEFKKEQETRAATDEYSRVMADFSHRVETEAKTLYPDWDAVVTNNQNLHISPLQEQVMLTDPKGHHLAHWYGTHPAETARIAQLPHGRQLIELGQVLATLGKAKPRSAATPKNVNVDGDGNAAPTTPKTTSAPRPVKPVGSRAPAKTSYSQKDIESMPYQQYKKLRDEGKIA